MSPVCTRGVIKSPSPKPLPSREGNHKCDVSSFCVLVMYPQSVEISSPLMGEDEWFDMLTTGVGVIKRRTA
jgi:hypothetical protein